MFQRICFNDVTKFRAILSCLSFSALYVGSLYIRSKQLPRDHPKTIKERILRVMVASLFVCMFVYQTSAFCDEDNGGNFFQWIGIRLDGLVFAIFLPSLLILLLFFGPLVMILLDHDFQNMLFYHPSEIIFWRNYVVAPLSEELVFRACMMPLLLPVFGFTTSMLLAPWFFGLAHIHHAYELYKVGSTPFSTIVLSTIFQTSYTTVFGILSSFIFLRTGHLISPFLSHSLCNVMGFPDFDSALNHRHKYFVCICFAVGLATFLVLLKPLTDPSLFCNNLYR